MKYRSDIDGLRAIAVISVVFFHYSIGKFFGGGYVGVDIFFVISGYLITSIIYADITQRTYSITAFYHRRVRRIFPALFTVFFACLVASFFTNFPSEIHDIGKSIASSIFFVSNILFYSSSSYFDQKMELNPVLHTWSLSVEEQFYVLFPMLVFAMRSLSNGKRILVLFTVSIVSFLASVVQVYIEPTAAFYLVQFRAWELLMGSLLALNAFPKLEKRWHMETLAGIGLLAIIASVCFYSNMTPFPGFAAFIPCAGATAIIYSGISKKTFVSQILGLPPVRFLGLISYSLYLWHWPLLVFTRLYHQPYGAIEKLSLFGICIILATISWWFIERPFRRPPYRLSENTTLGTATIVMISIATLAVSLGFISNQFWQYPERVENTLAYKDYDTKNYMQEGTCFLTDKYNSFSYFKAEDCLNLSTNKKNILIIGDSHAAHLWTGLKSVYPQINFLQATAAGCRPVINGVGKKRCRDLIEYIFNVYLHKNKVDAVILSGRWKASEASSTLYTAEVLRQFVQTVIISGPITEYDQPLPRILARAIAKNDNEEEFAKKHLKTEPKFADDIFSKVQWPNGVKYVSVYSIMQTPTLSSDIPVQFDYGHLTKEGSIYLADQLRLDALLGL